MALGKTITYTPFEETGFAYGSTELASNYSTEFPNATDIVKVVIEHSSGNWNDTGHISTPSIGTATSIYNSKTEQWICKGERDDVDYVLSLLVFYPADRAASRPYDAIENTNGHRVLPFKQNTTDGLFTLEQPPAIGDTVFTVKAYDGSDVEQISETITWDATEPTFDNQRPYFSTEPATLNYDSANYDATLGGSLDLGVLAHGTDEENIQVDIYFRNYDKTDVEISSTSGELDFTNIIQDNRYGSFVDKDDVYVNDKVPEELPTVGYKKFSLTGTVAECQAALDNLRYKTETSDQEKTFDIIVSVSDGPTGAVVKKTMWHTQTLQVTTVPDQHYVEDVTATFDLGDVVFANKDDLAEFSVTDTNNSFQAVITLDSTGQGGTQSFGTTTTVDTETYSSGVLTIADSDFNTFKTAIRNLEWLGTQDFATDFTFTVQFTFSNSTIGSSYTHTAQTVNVTAEEAAEVENITQTHTWNEDQVYYFENNNPLQIIHPYNENFRVEFDYTPSELGVNAIGNIDTQNQDVTRTVTNNNVVTFTGTRDQLNDALKKLQFIPAADYDQSFLINVKVERTSGTNLANADISTGVFTMTAIPQEDYSYTQTPKQEWNEDVSFVDFPLGIEILDTSTEDPLLPAFGAKYRLSLQMVYKDGSSVSGDDIVLSCPLPLNSVVSGVGTSASPLTITGSRQEVNEAINVIRMTPHADFTATQDFDIQIKLERGETTDSFYGLYIDYTKSVTFDKGVPSDEFTAPTEIKFGIERVAAIDGYKIVDAAKNKNYTVAFTMPSNAEGFLRAQAFGNATVSYDGDLKKLSLTGNKEDLNVVLETVEYIPGFGFASDFTIEYFQYQNTDSIQQTVGSPTFAMTYDSTLTKYELDTDGEFYYAEDLLEQKNILLYTDLSNLDGSEYITDDPIHYVTRLRLDPTTQIYFAYDFVESGYFESDVLETRGSEIVFTGDRDTCNNIIKNVIFSAFPDQILDANVYYSQERFRNKKYDEAQVIDALALTIVNSGDTGEVVFSPDVQLFTSEGQTTVANATPTQRYLQEFSKDDLGAPVKQYDRPLTIIDQGRLPEGESLYKLEAISSDIPYDIRQHIYVPEVPYNTKDAFHEIIRDGVRIQADEITNPDYSRVRYSSYNEYVKSMYHNRVFNVTFRVTRKLADGTETIMKDATMQYQFVSRPWLIRPLRDGSKLKTSTFLGIVSESVKDPVIQISQQDIVVENGDMFDVIEAERNFINGYWAWVYPSTPGGTFNYQTVTSVEGDGTESTTLTRYTGSGVEISKETDEVYFNNLEVSDVTLYYVAPFASDFSEISKFNHSITNKYGLIADADFEYEQDLIKYSEVMFDDSNETDFGIYGHDTGGQGQSFTININNEFVDDFNELSTMNSNLVLCSHFWISKDKYAYKFIDETSWPDLNTPVQLSPADEYVDFPVDKRYVVQPGKEMPMRVSRKSRNVTLNSGQEKTFDIAAKFDSKLVRNILWNASTTSTTSNVFIDYTSAPERDVVTHSMYTYDVVDVNNKTLTYAWYMTTGKAFENFYLDIYGQYMADGTERNVPIANRRLYFPETRYLHNRGNGISGYTNSSIDYALHKVGNTLYLLLVASIDLPKLKTTSTGSDYRFSVFNQAHLYKLDLTGNPEEFTWVSVGGSVLPDFNLGFEPIVIDEKDAGFKPSNFASAVYKWNTEKHNLRWGRKNPRDNTCRILAKNYNGGVAFILPTGEWIDETGTLNNFEDDPLFNLKTDLRTQSIDKFIDLGNNKLAYASVNEGVISDGGDINVEFINSVTLSSTTKFNYIYVTQDAYDPKKIYAMMRRIPVGNTIDDPITDPSETDYTTLSRLMFIDLN